MDQPVFRERLPFKTLFLSSAGVSVVDDLPGSLGHTEHAGKVRRVPVARVVLGGV